MADEGDELPDFAEDTLERARPQGEGDGAQPPATPTPLAAGRPLRDNELINESYRRDPLPLWAWLISLIFLIALLWGIGNWFSGEQSRLVEGNPFQQVTNRELQLFLWQFPEYMRVNSPVKEGYLPAFEYQGGKVSLIPSMADQYAVAPPEVLFLYHTWKRLLADDMPLPPVSANDLEQFLSSEPAWQPSYWSEAPDSYRQQYSELKGAHTGQRQQPITLPRPLHMAVVGWKGYTSEGPAIEAVRPTFGQLEAFLKRYPHYRRNYWRNIVMEKRPNYLKTISGGDYDAKDKVPDNELSAFLKVAFYNAQKLKP